MTVNEIIQIITAVGVIITALAAIVGALAAIVGARRQKKSAQIQEAHGQIINNISLQTNGMSQRLEDMARGEGFNRGLEQGRHESDEPQ